MATTTGEAGEPVATGDSVKLLACAAGVCFNCTTMREGEPGFDDPFRPPDIPTEVCCMHCGEEYESYLIQWTAVHGDDADDGFWCCPTPGCAGVGFCFDIWPTDPEWRDEHGQKVMFFDDDEGEGDDEDSDFLCDSDSATNPPAEGNGNDPPPDTLTDEDIPW